MAAETTSPGKNGAFSLLTSLDGDFQRAIQRMQGERARNTSDSDGTPLQLAVSKVTKNQAITAVSDFRLFKSKSGSCFARVIWRRDKSVSCRKMIPRAGS